MSGNPTSLSYSYLPPPWPGVAAMLRRSDGAFISCDLGNRDYQEFLSWLAAGNPAPEGWTGSTNPSEEAPP